MPPTVKPSSETAASFARVSVVRIASAASAPPSRRERRGGLASPASSLSSGSRTPITPVERTSTSSASRPSSRAASAAVASASSSPRSPVAAFATPELTTTACGSRDLEVRLRDDDRRGLDAVGREHRRADRRRESSGRARGPSSRLPDARADAGGDEALRRGDAHTSTPVSRRPGGLVEAEREVRVLDGLAGRALAEVVERADDDRACRSRGRRRRRSRRRRCPGRARARARRLRAARVTTGAAAYAASSTRAQVRPRGLHVAGREQPAADGQQVRDEADGEAERLLDLGRVLVRADAVRRDVLEHGAGVRGRLQRAAGAGDARLRVDDDAARDRSTRRAARARAARRSRSSRDSRSAALPAGRARGARRTSSRSVSGRGCSKPYHSG